MLDKFKQKIKNKWQSRDDGGQDVLKQKAIIIVIAIILAFLLWLVVSLNRSYTVDIKVPLKLGKVSADRALVEKLPESVTVRVTGEGWNLFSVYQNPPTIFVEVSNEQINLFDQVRRQLQAESKLRVQSVDPLYLTLRLQERVSKKVPVVARVNTNFDSQFGYLNSPQLHPDSVVVSGARSVIRGIHFWPTDSLTLNNVNEDIIRKVDLQEAGPLLTLSQTQVKFTAEVVKYTEGEVSVPVELQNALVNRNVIFTPQQVKITFLAPLKKFPILQKQTIFAAYVSYTQLMQDTTGFISPEIVKLVEDVPVKIQQVQPRQVAYFNIISGGSH